jgi:hypothetical protein
VILATAIVDTHALLQLVYVSLIAGVGICVVYAVAVIGVTRSVVTGIAIMAKK